LLQTQWQSRSAFVLVTTVSPAKADEPIAVPLSVWTRDGARRRVLVGAWILPREDVLLSGTCVMVNVLNMTHKVAAHGDLACSLPSLCPLVCLFSTEVALAIF